MADWIEPDWIEKELRCQLRPVGAPEALWDRLEASRKRPPAPRPLLLRPAWAVPALGTLLVLLTAGFLWGIRQSHTQLGDIAQLTDSELRTLGDSAAGESFPSDDPVSIRNWIKEKGNIDIELPSGRSGAIRLLGAKLVKLRGTLIAAVAYHVGEDSATLLVSRRSACCNADTGLKHLFAKAHTPAGTNLVSWNMREQAYTIAYAGGNDPQGGCLLCHAGAVRRL